MPGTRPTTGLLLVVLAAVVGAVLIWLPSVLIEQYERVQALSPLGATIYLAVIGTGAVLLLGASLWLLFRLWRNTRQKRVQRKRRLRNPSELSLAEQQRELAENLAASEQFAAGEEVPPEMRAEIAASIEGLEMKLKDEKLEIVAFGTISSGKSSLLNALAGRDLFRTDPRGGTTLQQAEIPWPGNDRVVLVDTPGLAEVHGEARAASAAATAKDADLVLFVVDGPLKAYEVELLRQLGAMEKRTLLCLNKEDWFGEADRAQLLDQIAKQAAPHVARTDIISIRAGASVRRRVRVLPDGSEADEAIPVPADIGPLAERMLEIVSGGARQLLLANLLLQSRGLVEQAKARVQESLDRRAEELVSKYMWAAGGAAAVNPIPLLDVAGGSAIVVKMVLDLARVYRQSIDADAIVQLLANLSKNLIAMLGVTAASPAVVSLVASMMKTVPGVGTVAGGLVQGLVQALVTRWIGKVFIAYFRNNMQAPAGGLAELARNEWAEVTRPDQLLKLIQAGREKLRGESAGIDFAAK